MISWSSSGSGILRYRSKSPMSAVRTHSRSSSAVRRLCFAGFGELDAALSDSSSFVIISGRVRDLQESAYSTALATLRERHCIHPMGYVVWLLVLRHQTRPNKLIMDERSRRRSHEGRDASPGLAGSFGRSMSPLEGFEPHLRCCCLALNCTNLLEVSCMQETLDLTSSPLHVDRSRSKREDGDATTTSWRWQTGQGLPARSGGHRSSTKASFIAK